MKKWSKDNKPADYADLIEPLLEAVEHFYELREKHSTTSFTWNGFDEGVLTAATCCDGQTSLSPDFINRKTENGESPMSIILGLALRQGMEQGRRLYKKDIDRIRALALLTKPGVRKAYEALSEEERKLLELE